MAPFSELRRAEILDEPEAYDEQPNLERLFIDMKYAAADLRHVRPIAAKLLDLAADALGIGHSEGIEARGWRAFSTGLAAARRSSGRRGGSEE